MSVPLSSSDRSDLRLSQLCLGSLQFGSEADGCDAAAATRIIHAYLDAGHNTIDTADVYGAGRSEEIVGRAIAGRRGAVVLATKGGGRTSSTGINSTGAHLERAAEASLRRLGTDYIDLYQVHRWDPATPIEETMRALDNLVQSGKVRYVGCSNYTGLQIIASQSTAWRLGTVPFVSCQSQYSLVSRGVEDEVLPTCRLLRLGFLAWGPLSGGILTGKYRWGQAPPPGSRYDRRCAERQGGRATRLYTEHSLQVAAMVTEIAADLEEHPATVALAWLLGRPGVVGVVVGPRRPDQLDPYPRALALGLPEAARARLEAASLLDRDSVSATPRAGRSLSATTDKGKEV